MTSTALQRALTNPSQPTLRPLPERASKLLEAVNAPPRLGAHHRIVHHVARDLVNWCERHYPELKVDREATLFGAATHDIGMATVTTELTGPGSAHQQAGYELLLAHGVDQRLARFTRTHTAWSDPGMETEDILVSLADKVWEAKRVPELEQRFIDSCLSVCNDEAMDVFDALDEILSGIAAEAGSRRAYQLTHSTDLAR